VRMHNEAMMRLGGEGTYRGYRRTQSILRDSIFCAKLSESQQRSTYIPDIDVPAYTCHANNETNSEDKDQSKPPLQGKLKAPKRFGRPQIDQNIADTIQTGNSYERFLHIDTRLLRTNIPVSTYWLTPEYVS
jgi:hypothetical protein